MVMKDIKQTIQEAIFIADRPGYSADYYSNISKFEGRYKAIVAESKSDMPKVTEVVGKANDLLDAVIDLAKYFKFKEINLSQLNPVLAGNENNLEVRRNIAFELLGKLDGPYVLQIRCGRDFKKIAFEDQGLFTSLDIT